MKKPKYKHTFGTAVWDDRDGALFTIQAIRGHFAHLMPDSQIIVVLQNVEGRDAKILKKDMESCGRGTVDIRVIEMDEPVGTCPPRQRIVDEADSIFTTIFDAHCIPLGPQPQLNSTVGCLDAIDRYYDAHPDTSDLLSGVIVLNDLKTTHTHFDDIWGGPMRGKWSEAWQRPDGKVCGIIKTTGDVCAFVELAVGSKPVPGCPEGLKYNKRRELLAALGWIKLAETPGAVFEIGCSGLGMFSFRTAAWPGFHPAFRGFTGGEWYIHELFRRMGNKCLCLADAKYWHRNERTRPPSYPNTHTDRARNYAIANQALGNSHDSLRRAFVGREKPYLKPEVFEQIIADPIKFPHTIPAHIAAREGFGTELLGLLAEHSIRSCQACRHFAMTLNTWGLKTCEDRREQIITVMRENGSGWGWVFSGVSAEQQEVNMAAVGDEVREANTPLPGDEDEPHQQFGLLAKAKVGLLAVVKGTVFKVDINDPFPGIFDESMRRAKVKAQHATS